MIASFSDVDTTSVAGAVATLYWDDGTSSTGSIVYNSDTGLFDVIGAHLYRRRGTYSVLIVSEDIELIFKEPAELLFSRLIFWRILVVCSW